MESTPAPRRRRAVSRTVKIFLALLILGTAASAWVFFKRIYPIQQQLAALKGEAEAFRARPLAEVEAAADPSVTWAQILSGEAAGEVVRIRGLMGLTYQIIEGASGGTLFLFPEDAASVDTGPRALVYFTEAAPPDPASTVEVVALVSTLDVQSSVSVISPEQLGVLSESIPGAILIAASPCREVAPPREELLPEAERRRRARAHPDPAPSPAPEAPSAAPQAPSPAPPTPPPAAP